MWRPARSMVDAIKRERHDGGHGDGDRPGPSRLLDQLMEDPHDGGDESRDPDAPARPLQAVAIDGRRACDSG